MQQFLLREHHTARRGQVDKYTRPGQSQNRVPIAGFPGFVLSLSRNRSSAPPREASNWHSILRLTWPCVFVDLPPPRGVVLSKEELLHLREKGKGLLADETPPGA